MAGTSYEHRQTSLAVAVPMLTVVVLALILPSALGDAPVFPGLVVIVVVAVVVADFMTLTTRVDEDRIHVAFLYGWPRRTIPVESIEDHEVVRNRWWYGWGVRVVPGGMLYNVWGLDAVAVTYRTGERSRTLRIGTDDPGGLEASIARARR